MSKFYKVSGEVEIDDQFLEDTLELLDGDVELYLGDQSVLVVDNFQYEEQEQKIHGHTKSELVTMLEDASPTVAPLLRVLLKEFDQ